MWKCPICLVFFLFFTLRVRVRNRKLPPLPCSDLVCQIKMADFYPSTAEIRPCQRIFSVKSVAQPHRAASPSLRSELYCSQYVPFWKDFYIPNRNLSLSKPYFATQHPLIWPMSTFHKWSYTSTASLGNRPSGSDAGTQWDKMWLFLEKSMFYKIKKVMFENFP